MSRRKKIWNAVLRITVSVGAIAVIVYAMRDSLAESFEILRHEVRFGWMAGAVAAYIGCQFALAFRFHLIVVAQGIKVRFRETLHLVSIGLFFNLFLPSAVGGDVAKIYYLSKYSGKSLEATSCILLDRIMGFITVISIAVIGGAIVSADIGDPRINYVIYAFLGVMLVTLLFFTNKSFARVFKFLTRLIPSRKIHEKLSAFYHAIHAFKDKKMAVGLSLGFSFAGQLIIIVCHYLIARSLDIDMQFWLFLILVPVIFIVSMAPSLGGLGVREAGAVYLFSRFTEPERALALSLLLDAIIYGVNFACGVLYALRGGLKGKLAYEVEEISGQ